MTAILLLFIPRSSLYPEERTDPRGSEQTLRDKDRPEWSPIPGYSTQQT